MAVAHDVDQRHRNEEVLNRMLEGARQLVMLAENASNHAPVTPLSEQERRILTLLSEGGDPATIARKLRISAQTLRNHLHHINRKLRTHNRLEAVTHAQRRGPHRIAAALAVERPSVHQPAATLARRLWRIAAAHLTSGNRIQLLHDGPATFDAMLALIEEARHSVDLESYILRSDEVGERFAPVLLAAARRGVHTRVLFDWIGSRSTSDTFVRRLRAGAVEVRAFNPFGLRRRWLGLLPRDHRKLLVVDTAAGVISGVGLGHEWLTGAQGRRGGQRWRDTGVRIEGPAAGDMAHAFARMWERASRPASLDSDASRPGERIDPDLATNQAAPALVGIIEGEPGRFRVSRGIQMSTVDAIRSIWISDAYFTPSLLLLESLTSAARDGVDVRLLLPGRSDHPWMVKVTRRYYRRLLSDGVRVWEWGGEMLHAKTAVTDGYLVRIGSTDYNPLGMAINFELDALIADATLGRQMEAMFLADLERSTEIVRPA